jgi:tricarballylate dehydrogenase
MMRSDHPAAALVIVGHGAAGLAAALSAAERAAEIACRVDITLVDRAPAGQSGGSTRFSPSNMRLADPARMAREFEAMVAENPRHNPAYFATLAREAQPAVAWLESHGVAFEQVPYYLAASPRYRPVGGGAALVAALGRAADAAGVRIRHDFDAGALVSDADGSITSLTGKNAVGGRCYLAADAVILACGSFAGNDALLQRHIGAGAETLLPISPGTAFNTGAGIVMAQAHGAAISGDWTGMHSEPIDPRARNPAAVVLIYPYGILVDRTGRRFLDEGAGLVHETWEQVSRRIHFKTPGRTAYAIFDAGLEEISGYRRAIRSEVEPVRAASLEELARLLGIPADALLATVARFNAHVPGGAVAFDAARRDGRATLPGLDIPKSNWAQRIARPPFLAWPIACGIAYTFGGLATNEKAEVLGADGPLPGLYAAGEITGHFYDTAPNAVSVLRALVFGRIAGRGSIDYLAAGKSLCSRLTNAKAHLRHRAAAQAKDGLKASHNDK